MRPAVPAGAENPIDAFILERLAKAGLHAAPEADRRTLIRRVTLDLTGLPPTPEETAAFVKDASPDAYEKLVDRLHGFAPLRRAAEPCTGSISCAMPIPAASTATMRSPPGPIATTFCTPSRDNKPFDEFTREQLAGDLIPNATVEQRVASAYNRLNRTSAEGGLQPKEYLAKYAADRVRTTVAVWMGSTLGCAECHDHKFDPFTQRDFYSMKAFFADIKETGLVPDRGSKAWGTQLALPTPEQKQRQEELEELITKRQAAGSTPKWKAWRPCAPPGRSSSRALRGRRARLAHAAPLLRATSEQRRGPQDLQRRAGGLHHYDGANLTSDRAPGNGLVVASGPNPDNETYTVKFKPGAGTWTALGVEMVQDESLPGIRVARGADRVVITEVDADVDGRRETALLRGEHSNLNNPAPEHPPDSRLRWRPQNRLGRGDL